MINLDYDFLVMYQRHPQMVGCINYDISFVKGNLIQEYCETGSDDSLLDKLKFIIEIVINNNPNKNTDDVIDDITKSINHPLRMLIEIANIHDNKFTSYALSSTILNGAYNNLVLFKYTKYTI